jgi:hypothetical protein
MRVLLISREYPPVIEQQEFALIHSRDWLVAG